MNRNFMIVAAVVVIIVAVISTMRSDGEDAGAEETAPAAASD